MGALRFKTSPDGAFLDDNALDFGLVRDVARHFRVSDKDAKSTLTRIGQVVAQWRDLAHDLGIARQEQEAMASAFRVPDCA